MSVSIFPTSIFYLLPNFPFLQRVSAFFQDIVTYCGFLIKLAITVVIVLWLICGFVNFVSWLIEKMRNPTVLIRGMYITSWDELEDEAGISAYRFVRFLENEARA